MEKFKPEQQLQPCFASTREDNDHKTKVSKVTARAIKPLATESWCQQVTPDKSKSVSVLRIENDKGEQLVGYLRQTLFAPDYPVRAPLGVQQCHQRGNKDA